MAESNEARLRQSWDVNAAAWTDSVRSGAIASRRAGTDDAVRAAVQACSPAPARILDVGCGEGWLARALASDGYEVTGFDGSTDLIESARGQGGGRFVTMTYEELAADPDALGRPFDAIICNFALLGEEIDPLLAALRRMLVVGGTLVIQTVPPHGDASTPYREGWRVETFDAFGDAYPSPMPWFFRTLGSWVEALNRAGFTLGQIEEPLHPQTHRPLSLVLTAQ